MGGRHRRTSDPQALTPSGLVEKSAAPPALCIAVLRWPWIREALAHGNTVWLADLPAARRRTVLLLGHECEGLPPEALELVDIAVEIPMVGRGASLNVAIAGSLVLYRLSGML